MGNIMARGKKERCILNEIFGSWLIDRPWFFFLCSNIFQAYRDDFQAVGQVNLTKLKNPFTAAINFDATLENLKARPGTWEFNFLVFNHQYQ